MCDCWSARVTIDLEAWPTSGAAWYRISLVEPWGDDLEYASSELQLVALGDKLVHELRAALLECEARARRACPAH
jgi:hypothetical protein